MTICNSITQVYMDGQNIVLEDQQLKTKSSHRTLPSIEPFETLCKKSIERQKRNKELCGNCYNTDYFGYACVDALGNLAKPDYISQHFAILLKRYDMPKIRFHDLRHSCATLLYNGNVDIKDIQAWLGHSTLATTADIYTHLNYNNKLRSAEVINSATKSMKKSTH